MKKIFIPLLFSTFSFPALASSFYAGGSLAKTDSRIQTGTLNSSRRNIGSSLITGIVGRRIDTDFSIEARLGLGISKQHYSDLSFNIESSVNIDNVISLYAVNDLGKLKNVQLYSLIGITKLKSSIIQRDRRIERNFLTGKDEVLVTNRKQSKSDIELSLGAGLNVTISNNINSRIEYVHIFDNDRLHEMKIFNFATTYKF